MASVSANRSRARPAPGYSSGRAQQAITRILAETLPKGMAFEWIRVDRADLPAGDRRQHRFLVLAAKYESLFLTIAIILMRSVGI
jgi:multidrug efflux pump